MEIFAGVASLADLAGNVAGGVTFLADPVSVVTDGVTFLEGFGVRSDSVFIGADGCDNGPDCFVCDEPGDFDICPDMTILTETVNVVSPGVTYHETPDVLVGFVYMSMITMVAIIRIVLTVLNWMILTVTYTLM